MPMMHQILNNLENYGARPALVSRYFRVLNLGVISEGGEVHHILPRSLFPQFVKETWNLVRLSHKAHFIAHLLLWKITQTKEMMFSFTSMSYTKGVKRNSRIYSEARESFKQEIGRTSSRRMKIDNPMFKPDVREKLSEINKGRAMSDTQKKLLSDLVKKRYSQGWAPRVGAVVSEETREKISRANTGQNTGELNPFFGKKHSEETRKLMIGKKSGLMPWEMNRFNLRNIPFYLKADELHKNYVSGLTGVNLCRQVFGHDHFQNLIQNIIKRFRSGWDPSECVKWKEWSNLNANVTPTTA